ncbi:MAG: hypothetical protein ATN35_13505 [Epulopiscium sp. Nele67-Bin004]|nr:MAG: hypothetical protein ATN35_13505 [Epulopiscium sp. Nele67-Bin004]
MLGCSPNPPESSSSVQQKKSMDQAILMKMKRGYLEMADINLSISNLYFQVESEVQSYYDSIVECE